jgi:hypothetical protein
MPIEPDEMPVQKPEPEIRQPNDPRPAEIPQEDPERIPQELPPDTSNPDRHEPEQPGKIS